MELRQPAVLAVGAVVTVVLAGLALRAVVRRARRASAPIANSSLLTALPEYRRALRLNRLRMGVLGLGAALLAGAALVGAARPAEVSVERPQGRNRDIMLCLDISGSMAAYDAALVHTFLDLVTKFEGERIGMVIFNSSAATVFPLTDDYDYIREELDVSLRALTGDRRYESFFAGTFNGLGTSLIGDGLATCVAGFDRIDTERARSVILATDNQLAGRPIIDLDEAIELAKVRGVRVYGLNPEEGGAGVEADEMRALVRSTVGDYYPMSNRGAVAGIVGAVQAQEATAIESGARRLLTDDPAVPMALAGLGLAGVVAATRRWGW